MTTWKSACLVAALVVLAPRPADAVPIYGIFGGEIDKVGGTVESYRSEGVWDAYGLGTEVGDQVAGSFAYDSVTGEPLYFVARVGHQTLTATEYRWNAYLFDTHMTFFYIQGLVAPDLWMGIGLTNGFPVFTETPPQSLNSHDWGQSVFNIMAPLVFEFEPGEPSRPPYLPPPIEVSACPTEATCSSSTRRSGSREGSFFLLTVSEPSTLPLFGVGLAVLAFARGRKLN